MASDLRLNWPLELLCVVQQFFRGSGSSGVPALRRHLASSRQQTLHGPPPLKRRPRETSWPEDAGACRRAIRDPIGHDRKEQ